MTENNYEGVRLNKGPCLVDPRYRQATLDDLKYAQEQLLSTLEHSKIIDTLGELALKLPGIVELLEPTEQTEVVDADDIRFQQIYEMTVSRASYWRDKDIIPLLGDVNFIAPAARIPMPAQREVIKEELVRRGDGDIADCDAERLLDEFRDNRLTTVTNSPSRAIGICSYERFPLFPRREEVLQCFGRPYIGILSSGIGAFDVATLSHEATHALDATQTAITECMTKEDKFRYNLKCELRAYAVDYYVGDYMSDLAGVARRTPSTPQVVERIRRMVNGPVGSEDAFAVHDDLIHYMGQAGLGYLSVFTSHEVQPKLNNFQ
jgi:hypothetical protein